MTQTSLPFSAMEYARRLELVQDAMRVRTLDWVLLDEPETMGWLSGSALGENLWRACVVPAAGQPFLLIRALDKPPVNRTTWIQDIVIFKDWEDPITALVAQLRQRGLIRRIGVDFQSNSFTRKRQLQLERDLPAAEVVDLDRSIWEARGRKSEEEIAHMRRAAALLDEAVRLVLKAIQPGRTQRDVASAAAAHFYRLGFDDAVIGFVTAGKDWDSLHNVPDASSIDAGDLIHIELLPRLNGYSARIMRSAVVGSATPGQRAVFQTLRLLQDQQLVAMRPGVLASDIDAIVRSGVIAAGLRSDYTNVTGYTLGYMPLTSQRRSDFHRSFTPTATWELEENMVFHMYTSARGFAVSETVVVTHQGAVRLTRTPRELFELPIEVT